MTNETKTLNHREIRALSHDIARARDPQVMRIVAMIDAMIRRGPADQLLAPARPRLGTLRPRRPLRFVRLIFHPLDPLIVPAGQWRAGQHAIPRTALIPMAANVRDAMGERASAIENQINGRTTADTDIILELGQSLWPEAACILRIQSTVPENWAASGLGDATYRPLADTISALLAESVAFDTICAELATGLLPPRQEAVEAIIARVAKTNRSALPMMIALILDRVPEASALSHAASRPIAAAFEQAADLLLGQLDQVDGVSARIAAGSVADAASAAGRIAALVEILDTGAPKPMRRNQLRRIRQRLDISCRLRFASSLQQELLAPLRMIGTHPESAEVAALESAGRGLRILEIRARVVGSGPAYDLLLGKAAEAIKSETMRDRLGLADQVRLIEILQGPGPALAMLDQV